MICRVPPRHPREQLEVGKDSCALAYTAGVTGKALCPLRHQNPSAPQSRMRFLRSPPRQQLIPQSISLHSSPLPASPMLGGGGNDLGVGGQRCHIWLVVLPQVSGWRGSPATQPAFPLGPLPPIQAHTALLPGKRENSTPASTQSVQSGLRL